MKKDKHYTITQEIAIAVFVLTISFVGATATITIVTNYI